LLVAVVLLLYPGYGRRLNQLSRWYPKPWMWILVGLLGLAARRPGRAGTVLAIACAGLLVVVLNALGLPTNLRYVLPVAPAFVLLGAVSLLGDRAPT
jgi:hypothetical protein